MLMSAMPSAAVRSEILRKPFLLRRIYSALGRILTKGWTYYTSGPYISSQSSNRWRTQPTPETASSAAPWLFRPRGELSNPGRHRIPRRRGAGPEPQDVPQGHGHGRG